jgi:hypothetical protein
MNLNINETAVHWQYLVAVLAITSRFKKNYMFEEFFLFLTADFGCATKKIHGVQLLDMYRVSPFQQAGRGCATEAEWYYRKYHCF